ncbi:MAG: GIY-YIG nuclease family protein [Burkholderiaceae bacterium]
MNALSKRNFVVYRIKNMINGRVYFGSTNNFNNRMAQHLKVMRGQGKGLPNYLRDIQRLGHKPEDFSFRVIARF